jgi:hypothetical protein
MADESCGLIERGHVLTGGAASLSGPWGTEGQIPFEPSDGFIKPVGQLLRMPSTVEFDRETRFDSCWVVSR